MELKEKNLIESILLISRAVDKERGYQALIDSKYIAMPELVKSIVYDMFIAGIDSHSCSGPLCDAYYNIKAYAIELSEKGFVNYK
jgi:hypothetical protein